MMNMMLDEFHELNFCSHTAFLSQNKFILNQRWISLLKWSVTPDQEQKNVMDFHS